MDGKAFGTWLLGQEKRHDWVGLLADQAKRDRQFPRAGTAHEIRAYLSVLQVDPDLFEALDDAEAEWLPAA